MWFMNGYQLGKQSRHKAARRTRNAARPTPFRPCLEALEDRHFLSGMPPIAEPDVFSAEAVAYRENHWDCPEPPGDGVAPPQIGPSCSLEQHLHVSATASGDVFHNDADLEGDPLTAALVSGPAVGNLTLKPDGNFTYEYLATQDLNTCPVDMHIGGRDIGCVRDGPLFSPQPIPFAVDFVYKVTDGTSESAPTAVTLAATVAPTPDAPISGIMVNPTSGLVTTEAGGTAQFSVVLATPPLFDVTVPLFSSDVSEGTISTSRLTFTSENWDMPQTVTVTGVDDLVYDPDMAYTIVTGQAGSADPLYDGRNAADVSVTNRDNDSPPSMSISDVRQLEGDGGNFFAFTVTLSKFSAVTTTVSYASANGTAKAGSDYEAVQGSLTFYPYQTTRTIMVWVYGDTVREADETFYMRLTEATNATIADGSAIATILNDDRRK